jgi:miniconductance mechanosensitive channel
MSWKETYALLNDAYPWAVTAGAVIALLLAAWLANFIVKQLLLRGIGKLLSHTRYGRNKEFSRHRIIPRLANIVPALIISSGIVLVPDMPEMAIKVVQNVATAFIVLTIGLALGAVLDLANDIYSRRPDAVHKPIKGYVQVVKIAVYAVVTILIIATLIDRSPLILLSGLGAMAAVLMLIFQDTLLSLVASVQISGSDMVRVGDWIEMPQLNADGDVIDIALHTVKVQNWDKTITTLPTRKLITDPFKNWRGMHESGGRRIKRALFLDQSSIHFLTEEEVAHLRKFSLLKEYLEQKSTELADWNKNTDSVINSRRITNIGTFRAYIENYLRHNAKIHQGMTLLVRQLGPTADGLPLEIYCFTNDTRWAFYEGIQSDIFDHLYAILPEFGLRTFQNPSGADMRAFSEARQPA